MKRVLLVYRGTVTGKIALHWLKHKLKMDVFTYTAQLGGEDITPESAGEEAMLLGVESAYFGELNEKFYNFILKHAVRSNIRGRNGSFLTNALSRPVIAREMADIAEENNCRYIAFTADPYSLDQIRYNSLFSMIAPGLTVISAQTEWPMRTYQDLMKYAREHNIATADTRRKEFSIEKNLWGSRIKCGRIEDLWKDTPDELYPEIKKVENASEKPKYVELEFESGIPIRLGSQELKGVELIRELNSLGIKNGIGRRDLISSELLGIKTRVIEEAPAAHIIATAHKGLEDITLSSEILELQENLSRKLTDISYQGTWFTDLREAICEFFSKTQKNVTGVIRLKLYKGNCIVMRRKAKAPLYNRELISTDKQGVFPVGDIEKFLNVLNMSQSVQKDLTSKKL